MYTFDEKEYTMANAKQMPSGNWRVQLFLGTDENGVKRKKSFTAPTRWEAEKMAAEYVIPVDLFPRKNTVARVLRDYIELKRNVLSPSTIHGYEIILKHRFQSIMDIEIEELDSITLQRAINEDAATLSAKSISEAKNLLITAMRMFGVDTEFKVTLPARQRIIKELPPADVVLKMIRGTEIELPCMLAIWLSLRVSEVRGLQFRDIKDGVMTIQRSKLNLGDKDVVRNVNKTYTSTRRLVVPPYIQKLIDAVPHEKDDDFVVQLSYQTIKYRLRRLAEANGFHLTFHELRHLNASIMLMLGVPDKYAMERGGWATNTTLKTVYQHTFSDERKNVDEKINGFVCGSDTIFCPDEFGFDDGYYANYDCMKNGFAAAYAASFGDPHFTDETYQILNARLQNFKAFGLRENLMIPYVSEHTSVPVQKVVDPTLLLTSEDYDRIAEKRIVPEKYLLLYARRYNPTMTEDGEKLAKEHGWKIIDISLRATNAERGHQMFYEAGVEEFLSLVKHAEYVVTNSFHGMIFSVQYRRPFVVFSREQCDTKIEELLALFGLSDRMLVNGTESFRDTINYDTVHQNIDAARQESIRFLKSELDMCPVKEQ